MFGQIGTGWIWFDSRFAKFCKVLRGLAKLNKVGQGWQLFD